MEARPSPKLGDPRLAAHIVPYLHSLTDVVALYSCASPLRDVVAPKMMEVLSAGDADDSEQTAEEAAVQGCWQTSRTTSEILQHTIFHGGRSATSCMVMKKVDISARHAETGNNFLSSYVGKADALIVPDASSPPPRAASSSSSPSPSPTRSSQQPFGSEAFITSQQQPRTKPNLSQEAANIIIIPVDDDVIVRIAKECVNMEELIADRSMLSDNALSCACLALARNEHFVRISLRECNQRRMRDLRGLARVGTLRFVDVSMTGVDAAGIAPLASLPHLETLVAIRCLNLVSIDSLAQSPSLQSINITACPVKSVDALAGLRTLERLFADGTKIQCLSALRDSTSLKSISLRNVPAPEEELEALELVPTLEHLSIYNANVSSVDFLSGFRNISSLDVGQLPLRTADLSRGEDKPHLSRLLMRGCPVVETIVIQKLWRDSLVQLSLECCVRLGDDGVEGLDSLELLTSLSLGSTAITNKTVENAVAKLHRLVELDLSNTHVSSVASLCRAEGGMPALKKIKLECCRYFTERGLEGVGTMPVLEDLDISCTAVRSLVSVMSDPWPSLQRLALRGVLAPPKGLSQFCLSTTMEILDLTGNSRSSGFVEVARSLRRNSYIFIVGIPYEMLMATAVMEQDPNERAVRGLKEVQASHARDRMRVA